MIKLGRREEVLHFDIPVPSRPAPARAGRPGLSRHDPWATPRTTMSQTRIEPYLFFGGRCDEALAHYGEVFQTQPEMVMRFADSPEEPPPGAVPDNWGDKVMHAAIRVGETLVMLSDGCEPAAPFSGMSLSVTLPGEVECRRVFDALADGGEVSMPLGPTFFSPCFGMVKDRFGLGWMITVPDAGGH